MTPQESALISINGSDGTLTINTSDTGFVGDTWNVALYRESTASTEPLILSGTLPAT